MVNSAFVQARRMPLVSLCTRGAVPHLPKLTGRPRRKASVDALDSLPGLCPAVLSAHATLHSLGLCTFCVVDGLRMDNQVIHIYIYVPQSLSSQHQTSLSALDVAFCDDIYRFIEPWNCKGPRDY